MERECVLYFRLCMYYRTTVWRECVLYVDYVCIIGQQCGESVSFILGYFRLCMYYRTTVWRERVC